MGNLQLVTLSLRRSRELSLLILLLLNSRRWSLVSWSHPSGFQHSPPPSCAASQPCTSVCASKDSPSALAILLLNSLVFVSEWLDQLLLLSFRHTRLCIANMVFFLSLRQTPNGQIEPDVPPSSASAHSHTALFTHPKSSGFSGTFGEYLTTWDFSGEKGALARKCACFLALLFHLPVNVISTMAHGWSPWIVLYLLLSVLNLACVAVGLWKLDVMRGQRLFYSSM